MSWGMLGDFVMRFVYLAFLGCVVSRSGWCIVGSVFWGGVFFGIVGIAG